MVKTLMFMKVISWRYMLVLSLLNQNCVECKKDRKKKENSSLILKKLLLMHWESRIFYWCTQQLINSKQSVAKFFMVHISVSNSKCNGEMLLHMFLTTNKEPACTSYLKHDQAKPQKYHFFHEPSMKQRYPE